MDTLTHRRTIRQGEADRGGGGVLGEVGGGAVCEAGM